MRPITYLSLACLLFSVLSTTSAFAADSKPPRLATIIPSPTQPHSANPNVLFYDPFDTIDAKNWPYLEPKPDSPHAKLSTTPGIGDVGHAMECSYPKGSQGIGNRKLIFGDNPVGKPHHKDKRFEDIYWRIYVKHPDDWTGNPDKMSRATAFSSNRWAQPFILHVWSSGPVLTLDPATGVRSDAVVTTRYNDFPNLKWLGNSPKGKTPIHAPEETGRWVCVEARLKLNTPGKKDGYAALWIDGHLDAERKNMDFRGNYTAHTINAIFLEAYWNAGSPKDQSRWYDDFVVSTKPIGPLTAPSNPTLIKRASPDCTSWELQIAADPMGKEVVFTSKTLPGAQLDLRVTPESGSFTGTATGKTSLPVGPTYFTRLRERNAAGAWSDWSPWHHPFLVAP